MKIMKMMPYARFSILLAMLIAVPAHADPAPTVSDVQYALVFSTIAADNSFHDHHNAWRQKFPNFDWNTDGCSGPAKLTGYADNFYWPCVQHDFGYRNNRRVHRHDDETRKFIDVELLTHMKQLCSHYAVLAKPGCYVAADNFYAAVRVGGGSYF